MSVEPMLKIPVLPMPDAAKARALRAAEDVAMRGPGAKDRLAKAATSASAQVGKALASKPGLIGLGVVAGTVAGAGLLLAGRYGFSDEFPSRSPGATHGSVAPVFMAVGGAAASAFVGGPMWSLSSVPTTARVGAGIVGAGLGFAVGAAVGANVIEKAIASR